MKTLPSWMIKTAIALFDSLIVRGGDLILKSGIVPPSWKILAAWVFGRCCSAHRKGGDLAFTSVIQSPSGMYGLSHAYLFVLVA